MEYKVMRTDSADILLRKIILYIAQSFGHDVALEELTILEKRIAALGENT